jgi:hypothetical protein
VIFPAFFEKHSQTFVQQFKTGKQQTKPITVVPAFHLFEGLKAAVKQHFEVGRMPQFAATLGAVQVVGRDNMGTTGAEADFHAVSLGQPPEDSNPFSLRPAKLSRRRRLRL